jgi:sec-independent protein translocase protein TatC
MAGDQEPKQFDDETLEGGPVKSFLEHLEDLRWVILKSVVALFLGMLICLFAAQHVVEILKWPLRHAPAPSVGTNQIVAVNIGTNRLTTLHLTPAQEESFHLGTNQFVAVQIDPLMIGTNQVLSWHVDNDPAAIADLQRMHIELINLSPAGGFVVAFQVAIYGGAVLAAPLIFYFISTFIFPALKIREQKHITHALGVGISLFIVGVSFCYFVLMPLALAAAQMYSNWLGLGALQWRAEDYISFVCKFLLGMGLGFELPVVVLTLVKIGVLQYSTLAKARRYMIVINLILGAVLTTPEPITQLVMFVPLQGLYEISVWIAWYWDQPDRAKARRTLLFALLLIVLVIVAIWAAWIYAWPVAQHYWAAWKK